MVPASSITLHEVELFLSWRNIDEMTTEVQTWPFVHVMVCIAYSLAPWFYRGHRGHRGDLLHGVGKGSQLVPYPCARGI